MEKESYLKKGLAFIGEHPKQLLIFLWVVIAIAFGIWRAGQPFNLMQPILVGFGYLAAVIGYVSLRLEKRDASPRKGASLMASAIMLLGAAALWFGLQVP